MVITQMRNLIGYLVFCISVVTSQKVITEAIIDEEGQSTFWSGDTPPEESIMGQCPITFSAFI